MVSPLITAALFFVVCPVSNAGEAGDRSDPDALAGLSVGVTLGSALVPLMDVDPRGGTYRLASVAGLAGRVVVGSCGERVSSVRFEVGFTDRSVAVEVAPFLTFGAGPALRAIEAHRTLSEALIAAGWAQAGYLDSRELRNLAGVGPEVHSGIRFSKMQYSRSLYVTCENGFPVSAARACFATLQLAPMGPCVNGL